VKQVAPITLADLPEGWIGLRQEIIAREGLAVRPGTLRTGFTIEIKSLVTNEWHPVTLANDATAFTSPQDRDQVLRQLQEGAAVP